jgi:hypothetical protein
MKKSELKQITRIEYKGKEYYIREEIIGIMNEGNLDIISRSLNILDKAADMAIKNPAGDVVQFAKIVKKYIDDIRKSL